MSTKKALESYEEAVNTKSRERAERDLDSEVNRTLDFISKKNNMTTAKALIKTLISKKILTEKDFKDILGEDNGK